jgi:hypothetical protein
VNVGFVVITQKASVSTKNANAASTSMFVRVQRNPIEIHPSPIHHVSKIKNIDEFRRIKGSDFGFIVIFDGASNMLHQTNCTNLTDSEFSNQEGNALHWFSTLALAEKSFNVTPCTACRPE